MLVLTAAATDRTALVFYKRTAMLGWWGVEECRSCGPAYITTIMRTALQMRVCFQFEILAKLKLLPTTEVDFDPLFYESEQSVLARCERLLGTVRRQWNNFFENFFYILPTGLCVYVAFLFRLTRVAADWIPSYFCYLQTFCLKMQNKYAKKSYYMTVRNGMNESWSK